MNQSKMPKTLEELERIAADRLKQQACLEQVEGATINLDEDGRWTVGVKVEGDVDVVAINRGRKAVEDGMRDQYSLQTDTQKSPLQPYEALLRAVQPVDL